MRLNSHFSIDLLGEKTYMFCQRENRMKKMPCIEIVECHTSISTSKCCHTCYCSGYNGEAELRSCQKATCLAAQGKHAEEWMHMPRSKISSGDPCLTNTGLFLNYFKIEKEASVWAVMMQIYVKMGQHM